MQKGFNSESSMLDHLWSKVHIEPLKKDELHMVSVVESITNLPLFQYGGVSFEGIIIQLYPVL